MATSGYRPCECRDCFEIAIGEPGALCWECEEAGCEACDCEDPERGCEHGECCVERMDEEEEAFHANP